MLIDYLEMPSVPLVRSRAAPGFPSVPHYSLSKGAEKLSDFPETTSSALSIDSLTLRRSLNKSYWVILSRVDTRVMKTYTVDLLSGF